MTPQAESVLELFRSTGAYLQGHFQLTSGLHSAEYLQSALVLQHPQAAEKLGRLLAQELRKIVGDKIALVAAPALGGMVIGHEVARALGVRFIFTERDATRKMALRRGFAAGTGETAVVVEDVITTGGSTLDVIEILKGAGVNVLGAGSIIDRSGGHADVGVHRVALATLQVAAHYPDSCPLCKLGIPVEKPAPAQSDAPHQNHARL